jgi:hypothetical protein
MQKRVSSFWLMVSQNCRRFVSFKELIVRRFILQHLAVVILFVSCFAQWSSAQCITSTIKSCGREQFSNECSEPCEAAGQFCGYYVFAELGSYRSVTSAPTGSGSLERIPEPVWCGSVRTCSCVEVDPFLGFACYSTRTVAYDSYWVHETVPGNEPCNILVDE